MLYSTRGFRPGFRRELPESALFGAFSSPETPRAEVAREYRQFSSCILPDCHTKPVLSLQLKRLLPVLNLHQKLVQGTALAGQAEQGWSEEWLVRTANATRKSLSEMASIMMNFCFTSIAD